MLEAVALITTASEIDNGRFQEFMKQFETMETCNLDFVVFVNKFTKKTQTLAFRQEIYYYTKAFKSVEIHCINIPPHDDIYIKSVLNKPSYFPPLGLCSGPNISFFIAMEYCKKYDTILLLETDCIVKERAFPALTAYINNAGDFLIAGAVYDGKYYDGNIFSLRHTHLNGVAFYKSGSSEFQQLMENVQSWIAANVSKQWLLPYDIAITQFVLERLKTQNGGYYRGVLRKLLRTTLILNYSIDATYNTDFNEITRTFPNHQILHIKPS
jgi:hypothetical protein